MKQLMINFGEWLIENNFEYYDSKPNGIKMYNSPTYDNMKVYTMHELMVKHSKQNRII